MTVPACITTLLPIDAMGHDGHVRMDDTIIADGNMIADEHAGIKYGAFPDAHIIADHFGSGHKWPEVPYDS